MRLPQAEDAEVDIRKLRDYCLDFDHDEGKHKARLFAATLGMTANDAEELRQALLLCAVQANNAELGLLDEYGQRYTVDFVFDWRGKRATIRSGWIVEHDSDKPRLTTCFPL